MSSGVRLAKNILCAFLAPGKRNFRGEKRDFGASYQDYFTVEFEGESVGIIRSELYGF